MSAVPASRGGELEHSRLGVIYFLGKLQVDFSPEASATEMKDKALAALQGKVGSGKVMKAATKVGGLSTLTALSSWWFQLRRHCTASNASAGCREVALTPRLIPPSVTRAGAPAVTEG